MSGHSRLRGGEGMSEHGETPAEKWLREQRKHKDLLAMTDKRQIVGPVLRKPEAPASREGEKPPEYYADSNYSGRLLDQVHRLEAALAREREAHAVTRLSERLYQEASAQAHQE